MFNFYKAFVSIYRKVQSTEILVGPAVLFVPWYLFTAVAGLSAALLVPGSSPFGEMALWMVFVAGLTTLVFGMYRSALYNLLCVLSAFISVLFAAMGWVDGDMQVVSASFSMFALLIVTYAFCGACMVLNMVLVILKRPAEGI